MSVKKPWGEEEHKKAIKAFCHVYPDWSIVSNPYHCPACLRETGKRRPYCWYHRWAYEKWLGSPAGVPMLALRDRKLKEEFKREV